MEGVSESEELGVAVLGQHFAEKVEHIPIKKRRFIIRSPSPSSRPSSRREGLERRAQINHALHVARLHGRTSGFFSEKADCNSHDDFSGIEILADVACSSSGDMDSDVSMARDDLFIEEPAQQEDPSTLSAHAEGCGSSATTVAVFPKDTANESKVPSGEMVCRNNSVVVSDESATGRESEKLAPWNQTVRVSEETSADPKDDRLYWDLNLSVDAWGRPCKAEGEVTESVAPMETGPMNSSKDHADGVISSDGHSNMPSPFGSKAEAAAENTKESQSGCDSQFEDGELREPYPCWEESDGDGGEVEQVDYGSEPDEYLLGEVSESKLDGVDKRVVTGTDSRPGNSGSRDPTRTGGTNEGSDVEKHVVVCLNESRAKGGPSPFRGFSSKPFKVLPIRRRRQRSGNYKESNERDYGSDKFVGRFRPGIHMHSRSPGRGHSGRWDSRRRISPTYYKHGSYGFGQPRPKSGVEGRGLMNGFDQPEPGPDRQVSGGVYRGGQFRRRIPDGGNRDLRGVVRGFPVDAADERSGRVNSSRIVGNRRERSNSPVVTTRRLHCPQPYGKSWSRSRSRSPVSTWSNGNRYAGFREDDGMKLEKRYPADKETGFMYPQRKRMSPPPRRNPRWLEGRRSQGRRFREGERRDNGGTSMRRDNICSNRGGLRLSDKTNNIYNKRTLPKLCFEK